MSRRVRPSGCFMNLSSVASPQLAVNSNAASRGFNPNNLRLRSLQRRGIVTDRVLAAKLSGNVLNEANHTIDEGTRIHFKHHRLAATFLRERIENTPRQVIRSQVAVYGRRQRSRSCTWRTWSTP